MRIVRFSGCYILLSLAAFAGLALSLLPWHPDSPAGWLALVLLALPLALAGELIGAALWRNRVLAAIDRRSPSPGLSWMRITYGVSVMLALCAAGWKLAHWLSDVF